VATSTAPNRVVILKPSKYRVGGAVERFRRGFMPNSTLNHLQALTPASVGGRLLEVVTIDEYIETDLKYLDELNPETCLVFVLAGVQSHQYNRALDLAALALSRGVANVIIGGPHAMTCHTESEEGRGLSFAHCEAELVWETILADAVSGKLRPTYGDTQRWQRQLITKPLIPPTPQEMRRYVIPQMGIYPSRGCPYRCTFCSVTQLAGRVLRNEPLEVTLQTLRAAKAAGVRMIMFTPDNFNKIPGIEHLLRAMIAEDLRIPFFVQCDTQVMKQPELIALMARAGCYQMFLGVESFNRAVLLAAGKTQNHPSQYRLIVDLCEKNGILCHFSNIVGFPEQHEKDILEHLATILQINPHVASFYILTPIPGSEQYADFLARGMITEVNMDRYDGTCVTWRHPHIPPERIVDLLFECYAAFYAEERAAFLPPEAFWAKTPDISRDAHRAYCAFSRKVIQERHHPMSGGFGLVEVDNAADYAALRRERFGFEMAPLPLRREINMEEMDLYDSSRA